MPSPTGWHRKRVTPATLARKAKYNTAEHRAARDKIRALVAAGLAHCWRCGTKLTPGNWHTGHDDTGTTINGPECPPCNVKTAAAKGARIRNAKRNATAAFTRARR